MARPREFDTETALQEAVETFWDRGYEATSIADLLEEMKLHRGSLYGAFGDKRKLFFAAIEKYDREGFETVSAALHKPGNVRQVIGEWVREVAAGCCGDSGKRGCLVIKAAIEMAPHDAEIATWFRGVQKRNEQLLADVLARGQAKGEINPSLEPRAVARFLLTSLFGLKMLGTATPEAPRVAEVVNIVLKTLD